MAKKDELIKLIEPVTQDLGFELVGVEYHPSGKHARVRIYIDLPGDDEHVGLDDCAKVSRQVEAMFDLEDPIHSGYTLEVSSPGLDRPLFNWQQFDQFTGQVAKVVLGLPIDGRRKFTGRIDAASEEEIVLLVEEEEVAFSPAAVQKAKLVPDYDNL